MIFSILMYWNKRCKTFCIVINNVLSIVINIQNTTIFEPVILTAFTLVYICPNIGLSSITLRTINIKNSISPITVYVINILYVFSRSIKLHGVPITIRQYE